MKKYINILKNLFFYHIYPIIYDFFITSYTKKLYKYFLLNVNDNSNILDVGIGTGTGLMYNSKIIKEKNLKIDGVDYDKYYINIANKNINKNNISNNVNIFQDDINNYLNKTNKKYDYILFSDSYSVIPDINNIINNINYLLKENGSIKIITTIDDKKCTIKDFIKRNMYYFSFLDFGKQINMKDFIISCNKYKITSIKNIYSRYLFLYGKVNIYEVTLVNKN